MADEAIGRFHWLVIDTVDPAGIAPFWCALLGVEERGWFGDDYLMLKGDEGTPPVAFQRVPEAKSIKNRLHIDVHASGGRALPSEPAVAADAAARSHPPTRRAAVRHFLA